MSAFVIYSIVVSLLDERASVIKLGTHVYAVWGLFPRVLEYVLLYFVNTGFVVLMHLMLGEGRVQVVEDVLNAIFLLKREMLQPMAV